MQFQHAKNMKVLIKNHLLSYKLDSRSLPDVKGEIYSYPHSIPTPTLDICLSIRLVSVAE